MRKVTLVAAMILLCCIGSSLAQQSGPDPVVEQGIPGGPFPQCGPGEVGVTQTGRACWNGPLQGDPLSIQVSQTNLNLAAKQKAAFCQSNAAACYPDALNRAFCRANEAACFGVQPNQILKPIQRNSPAYRYALDASGTIVSQYDMDSGDLISTSANSTMPGTSTPATSNSCTVSPPMRASLFQGPSWLPPPAPMDLSMALNPSTDMLIHVNNGLYFYGNTGNLILNESIDEFTFWCTATAQNGMPLPECLAPPAPSPGDTQVVFDYTSLVWIVSALSSNHTYLYVAVSQPDTGTGPPGKWKYYYTPACSN